jgi:hypothetical protein
MPGPVLPAVTHDKTKTVIGRKSVLIITPAGGAAKNYLVDYLGDGGALDVGRYTAPGADNGPAFTPETWLKSRSELFRFRTKEIKKIIADFGSLNFHTSATATMIVRDPRDAANKAALVSEANFACSVYRDPAEVAHSGDNPSEITIVIESHKDGAITWTPDGDTSAPA